MFAAASLHELVGEEIGLATLRRMLRYPPDFRAEDFDELREVVAHLGQAGPFDASQLLQAYLSMRLTPPCSEPVDRYRERLMSAGCVTQILDDLADLDVVRPLGGSPTRWELVSGKR